MPRLVEITMGLPHPYGAIESAAVLAGRKTENASRMDAELHSLAQRPRHPLSSCRLCEQTKCHCDAAAPAAGCEERRSRLTYGASPARTLARENSHHAPNEEPRLSEITAQPRRPRSLWAGQRRRERKTDNATAAAVGSPGSSPARLLGLAESLYRGWLS